MMLWLLDLSRRVESLAPYHPPPQLLEHLGHAPLWIMMGVDWNPALYRPVPHHDQ